MNPFASLTLRYELKPSSTGNIIFIFIYVKSENFSRVSELFLEGLFHSQPSWVAYLQLGPPSALWVGISPT